MATSLDENGQLYSSEMYGANTGDILASVTSYGFSIYLPLLSLCNANLSLLCPIEAKYQKRNVLDGK